MRKWILLSLVLVVLMQSWAGGFWSVRSVMADVATSERTESPPKPCCAAQKVFDGDRTVCRTDLKPTRPKAPALQDPCQCPDRGGDCCCLRALTVNGGFVAGHSASPTVPLSRDLNVNFEIPASSPAQIFFLEEEKIAAALPPVFKLKVCFLI